MSQSLTLFSGYSPPISIELQVGADRFNVASMGTDWVILRDARRTGAVSGVLRLTVDQHVTVYKVKFPDGIDPTRDEQNYRVIESSNLSAVA